MKINVDVMALSERVIMYRARNHVTQTEFARRAGVSTSTISHLERSPESMRLRFTSAYRIQAVLDAETRA